jgi:TPR repeat protein
VSRGYRESIAGVIAASCSWIEPTCAAADDANLEAEYAKPAPVTYASVVAGKAAEIRAATEVRDACIASRLAHVAHAAGDHASAWSWLEKAVSGGDRVAKHNTAYMLDAELVVVAEERNTDEVDSRADAFELYCDAGFSHSLFRAGIILLLAMRSRSGAGERSSTDSIAYAKALRFIDTAARAGHPEANLLMGTEWMAQTLAAEGLERRKRIVSTAIAYLKRASDLDVVAADSELAFAHAILADLIDATAGGEPSPAKRRAAEGERRASFAASGRGASRGHAACQEIHGRALLNGHGCRTDAVAALRWLIRAGENGAASAKHDAALMVMSGRGVRSKDVARAVKMLEEIVRDHGDATAMCSLGIVLQNGYPEHPPEPERAVELLKRSADSDHIPAVAHILIDRIVAKVDDPVAYRELIARLAGATSVHHPYNQTARHTLAVLGEIPACAACYAVDGRELKPCSRCTAVKYCSRACQRKHWPVHKAACRMAADPVSEVRDEVAEPPSAAV